MNHPDSPSSQPGEEQTVVVGSHAGSSTAGPGVRRAGTDDDAPAPARGIVDDPLVADDEPADEVLAEASGTKPPTGSASVGRASAIMAAGSLVSRILGFVRLYLFTAVAGVMAAADAFNVANTMPNYLLMVLNAGVLSAVLIPQITAATKRDDGGQEYVDRLLTASFACIAVLTVAGLAASPWLIRGTSSLHGPALRLAVLFGYICMPQVLFYGLYAVLGNVLNARDQFAAFMWAPALANVVQIAGLGWFLWRWGAQPDPATWTWPMVWTLAGSTTLGIAVQALALVPPLLQGGFRYRPRWGLRGSGLGEASRMVGWTVTALLVSLAGGLVVQKVLTAMVPPHGHHDSPVGGQSAYQNAMLVFALPHGLITISILTAIFPRMSRAWADGDVRGLRHEVVRGLTTPAVLVIPCSAALFVLARPVVDVMMHLGPQSAGAVAGALRILSIGILGYGISVLQQRYCFARGEGRANLAYQAFLTAIQVAAALVALWLVPPVQALPVVAWGVVVGNWAQSLVFMAVARRQLGGLDLGRVARLWTRLLLASVPAAGVCWLVVDGMRMFAPTWLLALATCALGGLAFGLVFLAISRILHVREVEEVLAPVLRRVGLAR